MTKGAAGALDVVAVIGRNAPWSGIADGNPGEAPI
jgi:hypothetical protein